MPKKELTPELKAIYTIIDESGEKGTDLFDLFDNLGKDYRDRDTLIAVETHLDELREMGLIHRKIVEVERTEKWVTTSLRWFVVGKGESARKGSFLWPIPG